MADPLEPHPEGFRVRLRYGKGLRGRFVIRLSDQAAADRRATGIRELAERLVSDGRSAEALLILKKAGEVQSEQDFAEVVRVAEELCKDSLRARRVALARTLTFREL